MLWHYGDADPEFGAMQVTTLLWPVVTMSNLIGQLAPVSFVFGCCCCRARDVFGVMFCCNIKSKGQAPSQPSFI